MALPSILQTVSVSVAAGTSGNNTLTGVVAGNAIIVQVLENDANARTFTCNNGGVDTFATAAEVHPGRGSWIIYAVAIAASGSVTVNIVASASCNFTGRIHEVQDVTAFDVGSFLSEGGTSGSHNSSADATVIDTVANVIVFAGGVLTAAATATAIGGGYNSVISGGTTQLLQWKTSAGALTNERGPWTSSGTARSGVSAIASFVGTAAGRTALNTRSHPLGIRAGMGWRVA